jgi:fucose permease
LDLEEGLSAMSAGRNVRPATYSGYYGFVLIGWNAVLIPSLIRSMEQAFHQSDAAFGLFYFISAVLYAVGSFSGGFLIERLGRKVVLSLAAFLMGAGLVGEAVSPSWLWLLVAALAVNWGSGAIDGGINGMFLDLYTEARGGALSLLHTFFSVGAFIGPFAVGHLIAANVGWRGIVFVSGLAFFLLAGALLVSSLPSGRHTSEPADETAETYNRVESSLLPFAGLAVGICCYVAAEIGVSSWLVRSLSNVSITTATDVLSIFWVGLALGRLLSRWVAEWFDYTLFAVVCIALASISVLAAVLTPIFLISVALYGLAGLFNGPIYPMIMAIGGNIYPHRLAALSGSLAAAAVVGSVAYPPLVGIMASHIGIRAGLLGAGILGIPAAAGLLGARVAADRLRVQQEPPAQAAS